MDENKAGTTPATSEELSLRLASLQKELDQLTAEYPVLLAKKMQERTDIVDLLKTENDPDKADELWKKYDRAGTSFSQWVTEYQDRIAELTRKIRDTNDLLWKSQKNHDRKNEE